MLPRSERATLATSPLASSATTRLASTSSARGAERGASPDSGATSWPQRRWPDVDPRGFPETLPEFQKVFPTEEACAAYLEKLRWPDGFSCPKCVVAAEPWRLAKPGVLKCSSCRA